MNQPSMIKFTVKEQGVLISGSSVITKKYQKALFANSGKADE
jgi:hypothetical protein